MSRLILFLGGSTLRLEHLQDHGGISGGDQPLVSNLSKSLFTKCKGHGLLCQDQVCRKGVGLTLAGVQG